MKALSISSTSITPTIDFDQQTGELSLKGRSLPEQAYGLYKPVIDWLEEYVQNPADKTVLDINLEYFNSSSNKYLLLILKKLDDNLFKKGKDVIVNWYYDEDDEDSYDTALEYNEVLDLDIKLIPQEYED